MERFRTPAVAWILAMSVIAGMSICCCTGKTIQSLLDAASRIAMGEPVALVGGGHGHGHSCCDADEGCDDDSSSGKHDQNGPCRCDKFRDAKQLPDAPGAIVFAPAPTVIAAPVVEPDAGYVPRRVARVGYASAAPRPPTSLVRLHCALNI